MANTTTSINIAISGIAAILMPIKYPLIVALVFILVDLYYGLRVAKKVRKKIDWNYMWRTTVDKFIDSSLIIILGHLIDVYIPYLGDKISLCSFFSWFVCITQLISILSNQITLHPQSPLKLLKVIVNKKIMKQYDIDIEKEMEQKSKSAIRNKK